MSGDIVERLRRLDDWLAGSGTAADELQEAADEIVRLRGAGQQLLAALTAHDPHHPDCSCHRWHGTCDCGVHDACNEWEQEARRG